ncbi:hypothetical protein EJ07DRAFT_156819 [Lizonia empirigonia]|nr:hypothetical protein EJ07DRAFT_156819 [Lizonia empirigonia]
MKREYPFADDVNADRLGKRPKTILNTDAHPHRPENTDALIAVSSWQSQIQEHSPTGPPTPSASSSRGPRSRPARSRTLSPKRPTPQTYRTRKTCHAGIFVEALFGLPDAVDRELQDIFGCSLLQLPGRTVEDLCPPSVHWYQEES